jgi:dTDP-4-amino-4,6-dideoxygalactose transaminase
MKDLPLKQKQLDDLLASLHRVALKVLETPREERDAVYEIMREGLRHAATIVPVPPDMEDQYMT